MSARCAERIRDANRVNIWTIFGLLWLLLKHCAKPRDDKHNQRLVHQFMGDAISYGCILKWAKYTYRTDIGINEVYMLTSCCDILN